MHGAGLQPGKTRGRAAFRHGEGPHGSTGPGRSRRNAEARRQGSRPLALFEAPDQRPPVAHELPAHAPAALLAPRHKAPRLKAVAALGAVHLHFRKAWRAESARRKSPAISIACCVLEKPFRALEPCHAPGFRGQKLRLHGPDFQRGSKSRTGLAPGKASASHRTGPGLEGLLLSGRTARAGKAGSYGAACLFQGLVITSFLLTLRNPRTLPGKRRSGPAPSGRRLRVPGIAPDRRGMVLSHQSRFLPPALPRVRSGGKRFGLGKGVRPGLPGLPARLRVRPRGALGRAGLNRKGFWFPALGSWGIARRCFEHA